MLEKKLVTLVCAAGILACGACFLPPLPQHRPQPPQVQLDLQGVQSIRVEVTNNSASHHLDSSELAQAIANSINWRTKETGVNAHVQKEAGDAVLAIAVLSEMATPGPILANGGTVRWTFDVKTSASLTKLNGQTIWHSSEAYSRFSRRFAATDQADVWKDPMLQSWLATSLSQRLVYRMFYVF